jgi:3,4-dihydroxy 2-butanone 4-phosphate synthase / GTP cyclohydrolase II
MHTALGRAGPSKARRRDPLEVHVVAEQLLALASVILERNIYHSRLPERTTPTPSRKLVTMPHDEQVKRFSEARLPTPHGEFACVAYESLIDGEQHLAMVKGEIDPDKSILVRVHSECLTGDVFGSLRCDCGPQLDDAMAMIAQEGCGVIIYLRGHEGRGIGIGHKIRAYSLQESGRDTVDANLDLGFPEDTREYGIGAQMLVDLGVKKMRLITNSPQKFAGLEGFGLDIVERVPSKPRANAENVRYLRTKKDRMGHLYEESDLELSSDASETS